MPKLYDDFGWSSNADDNYQGMDDTIAYIFGTAPFGGTLDSFWFRVHGSWSNAEWGRGAIFVSSTKEIVAQTPEIVGTSVTGWLNGSFGASSITANEDYIIALWGDAGGKNSYSDNDAGEAYWTDTSRDYSASTSAKGDGDFSEYLNPFDAGLTDYNKTDDRVLEFFVSYYVAGTTDDTVIGSSGNVWIYYSSNQYPKHAIGCWCSRWDEDNWSVIFETYLTSSQRDILAKHITPGAYRELFSILGLPKFIDTTYSSSNTLMLEPQDGFGISSIREKRDIAVKNYMDWVIPHTDRYGIKIEGVKLNIEED